MNKVEKIQRFIEDQNELIRLLLPHVSSEKNESFFNGLSAGLNMIQFYMSNTEDDPRETE